MNEFMKILLSLSISGTLLLLLILSLKPLYQNKFSRHWQYYIWLIVVLRFLIPFTPDAMNIGSLLQKLNTTAITGKDSAGFDMPAPVNTNFNMPVAADTNDGRAEPMPSKTPASGNAAAPPMGHSIDLSTCFFFVWSVTALILLTRKITNYQLFLRYIKAGSIEEADIRILNLLSDCEEKQKIKARVKLCRNTSISSPIMIGFFRPTIVLPIGELEDRVLSHIFAHELFHHKHMDMFYKWLMQIVACIHWFNPFLYVLEKEVNKACELSCDEAVISTLDDKARREYGDTLIHFLKPNIPHKNAFISVTLTEGGKQIKERLGAIMHFKKKSKAIKFSMGILTLCILFSAAFVGVYPATAKPSNSVTSTNDTNPSNDAKKPSNDTKPANNEKSNTPTIPEQKPRKTDTYIYDEDSNSGWYLDNEPKDSQDSGENNWNEDKWNKKYNNWYNNIWDDDALLKAYATHGIEKKGNFYYYNDELVYIIKDQRPDSAFYLFSTNLKGTVSIKVIRDTEGEITNISYMTEEEIAKLQERAFGGAEEIPSINTVEWNAVTPFRIKAYYKTDNIYILPSPSNKVILKEYLTEDSPDYYAITEFKNNTLTIRSGDRPTVNYKSYIEIYIPTNVLDNVKIETISGAITVTDYTGTMALTTTSGAINIYDSEISGNINTISGSIGLYPTDIQGNLSVNSHSGKILAFLPTPAHFNIKAETTTGKIKNSYPNTLSKNKNNTTLNIKNNSKSTLTMKTFSANIEIN